MKEEIERGREEEGRVTAGKRLWNVFVAEEYPLRESVSDIIDVGSCCNVLRIQSMRKSELLELERGFMEYVEEVDHENRVDSNFYAWTRCCC